MYLSFSTHAVNKKTRVGAIADVTERCLSIQACPAVLFGLARARAVAFLRHSRRSNQAGDHLVLHVAIDVDVDGVDLAGKRLLLR